VGVIEAVTATRLVPLVLVLLRTLGPAVPLLVWALVWWLRRTHEGRLPVDAERSEVAKESDELESPLSELEIEALHEELRRLRGTDSFDEPANS